MAEGDRFDQRVERLGDASDGGKVAEVAGACACVNLQVLSEDLRVGKITRDFVIAPPQ